MCSWIRSFYFPKLGINPIYALGVGVLLGGLGQAVVQLPTLIKHGLGPARPEKVLDQHSSKIIKQMGPGSVGFAANQVNVLVNNILATGAGIGAVSWLYFAYRLYQFPVGILGVSIANSNLVHFSETWKNNQKEEGIKVLKQSYFFSLFLILPVAAMTIILAPNIIHLIYQHGKFSFADTMATGKALQLYALGLPFYGVYKVWAPTFYTINKAKIPMYTSLVCIGFNILFCVSFVDQYGYSILALGTSLSILLNSLILSILLKVNLNLELKFFISLRLLKVFISSLVVGLVLYKVSFFYDFEAAFLMNVLQLMLLFLVGGGVYLVSLLLMGEGKALKMFKK